eukprot:CAMPEP_0181220642 /NCGR_PEP_ID=MMETSP1096-20121128/28950_1 /TAXON_ID=156174 ORGANISM="Chrysochromulina ericina, Strain CCMP281" /NCGR_SAMPLE_ID=MMETSP1096 /ASSEMBLY_ACC=CAM_ASM_000453 /LENGTH=93 /DNA_ID=CAMNT_0023313167 /DNA_START=105 /DNA_END=387 /DNA_ORIENTATION=-
MTISEESSSEMHWAVEPASASPTTTGSASTLLSRPVKMMKWSDGAVALAGSRVSVPLTTWLAAYFPESSTAQASGARRIPFPENSAHFGEKST